jgi:Ca2+-binding RTX toxin-like protein
MGVEHVVEMRAGRVRFGAALLAILAASLLALPAVAEVVRGTQQADRLAGTPKRDVLEGRMGDDRLSGKSGRDILVGGGGADKLLGGPAYDLLRGGGGDDVINARDGEPDLIICGRGVDRAVVDAVEDGVFDCEEVSEP